MSHHIYHWISISLLAELSGCSENKIRNTYNNIIENECVPLSEIPPDIQEQYVSIHLADRLIDFSFLAAIRDYSTSPPLKSVEIQELFNEMEMLRLGRKLSEAYAGIGKSTQHLKQLAAEYNISYSTYTRRRKIYMNNTSLYRALTNNDISEDTHDRYRTCCFYCRDL